MLKAGIFLDVENLKLNGGWGMRYRVIRDLVEAQGATVLRANAYIAIDSDRERRDSDYREKSLEYREAIRSSGFHINGKEVKRFKNPDGSETLKANADLDMAVDTILQSENLDYILIGSGDGDFLRLVKALQNKGKRVDALAFNNVSGDIKREADFYFSGAIIPNLLPVKNASHGRRVRGIIDYVNEEKGFGFISIRTGFKVTDIESNIFCHITSLTEHDKPVSNERFSALAARNAVIEFDKTESAKGIQAENAVVYQDAR